MAGFSSQRPEKATKPHSLSSTVFTSKDNTDSRQLRQGHSVSPLRVRITNIPHKPMPLPEPLTAGMSRGPPPFIKSKAQP